VEAVPASVLSLDGLSGVEKILRGDFE